MKKFVGALLVVVVFAGSTAIANATPSNSKPQHDIVNFWEVSARFD